MRLRPWRRWLNRKSTPSKAKGRSLSPIRFEQLEDRFLPAVVSWINPSGGNWDMGSNWSSGSVPGSSDTVAISTTSPATITIQAGDAITIQSLTTGNNDTLSFTGGSLTITSSSTLNGPLTLTAGTLTASGSAITVTAAGATTLSGVSPFAEAGATLSLPGLTRYNTTGTSNNIFQAQGAGSLLSLPALASVTQTNNNYTWSVKALTGGTVNLSALTSLTRPLLVSIDPTPCRLLLVE